MRLIAPAVVRSTFAGPLLVLIGTVGALADEDAIATRRFSESVGKYFEVHCERCHQGEEPDGDFDLTQLSRDVGGGGSASAWREVIERINSGEMPPEDEPKRPTAAESARVVEWLADRIKEGEAVRLAKRGPISFHRLSREEYANTVRDLLGVTFDVADPEGLTEDDEFHGFTRVGSALTLSASHVEKYLRAAETLLDEAYPEKEPEYFVDRKTALDLRGGPNRKELEESGRDKLVRVDMWPGHQIQGGRPGPQHSRFRSNGGTYKVRVKLSGLRPANGRAPRLAFYAQNVDRMLFEQDIVAPEDEPIVVEFTAHLPQGSHGFRVWNDVPGPSILPRSGRSGRKPFFSLAEGRIPWQLKLTDEEGRPLYPFLIIDWIEWEGPIVTDAEQQKRDRFLPDDLTDDAQVREKLRLFLRHAFRRPVTEAEVSEYAALATAEREAGSTPLAAYKTALLAALCAHDFLHVVEGNADTAATPAQVLTDHQLASRLSYFLWGSMPDAELFRLAEEGRLSDANVLAAQVDRMLADPRAKSFATAFPFQWLRLHKVGMFAPDSKLYPDYDAHLEKSMVDETLAFFGEVLDQNLSLSEFLVSDWTMLNSRLALHYGIDGVDGDAFTRVSLQPEHHRGGLLRHGSILSLTSDGTRHRPVHRGVWISESIFGKTPPPPPANVDPIEPNPSSAPKATIRMKLEAHNHDQRCASCHRKIDPLGLAFDHFDAIGRYRTTERVQAGTGPDPAVDASGTLPDGRTFNNADEFQRLLLDDIDTFAETFVTNLATFAMRRVMTVDDRDQIAAIARSTADNDYRLRDVLKAFILSDQFRKR